MSLKNPICTFKHHFSLIYSINQYKFSLINLTFASTIIFHFSKPLRLII